MTCAAAMPIAAIEGQPRVRPAVDVGRPIRAAVLSNPNGGFNRRRNQIDEARREVAAFGVEHIEASLPEEIYRETRRLDAEGVELLIVNGGDGTLQIVLTALFSETRRSPPPLLAIVPGGTSNTVHGDAGWSNRPPDGIRDALAAAQRGQLQGQVVQRPVLKIESSLWERPMCAMQFSAGAIYNAIRFAKREVEGRGALGQTGPTVTLAWFIITILSGKSREIFPPMRVTGSIDGKPLSSGPLLANLVSTLDHLFLGIRPFWGSGPGRIRYSALGYRPRRFLLALWPLVRGRRGRFATRENGYTSHNAELLDLTIDAGFMLDGELFDAAPGTRIRITAPVSASFLCTGAG